MKLLESKFFIGFTLLCLFSCAAKEQPFFQDKYTSADLLKIHGGHLKDWRIEAFYENYKQKVPSQKNACFIDDSYVFQIGTNEIQVKPGEISCSNVDAADELTSASYSFYEEEGLLFISISKAFSINGVIKNNFFSLQLVELSDTHMIFASGEKDNYEMALVFEAI